MVAAEVAEVAVIEMFLVSAVMRGEFGNISERKLMECLNGLGYDIEIQVRPACQPRGNLTMG